MILEISVLLGAYFAYLGAFLGIFWLRKWRLDRQNLRAPFAEKLLRGPGEGLQKKLEALDEQLSTEQAATFVLPLMCASVYLIGRHTTPGSAVIVGVGISGIILFVLLCRRMFQLLDQRRKCRLGLLGERSVGEELNQMMLSGCRVFHDVPNDPYGNIDHVLIAPSGVYAVETKARRKKEGAGKEPYTVTFDGVSLRFAGGPPEKKCLDQAKQQANRLSDLLSKAIAEPVAVRPVLALPGWYVERSGKGEVLVVSGKKAGYVLAAGPAVLEDAIMERIAHQLDQRCRDVTF